MIPFLRIFLNPLAVFFKARQIQFHEPMLNPAPNPFFLESPPLQTDERTRFSKELIKIHDKARSRKNIGTIQEPISHRALRGLGERQLFLCSGFSRTKENKASLSVSSVDSARGIFLPRVSLSGESGSMSLFKRQEALLELESMTVAPKTSIALDDPMAGGDDRNGVRPVRISYRAKGFRMTNRAGNILV